MSDLAGWDNEHYIVPATTSSVDKSELMYSCCVCVNDVLFKKKDISIQIFEAGVLHPFSSTELY